MNERTERTAGGMTGMIRTVQNILNQCCINLISIILQIIKKINEFINIEFLKNLEFQES